jgi:hypothetical protein
VNHISTSLEFLLCGCILGLNATCLTDVENTFMVKHYFKTFQLTMKVRNSNLNVCK